MNYFVRRDSCTIIRPSPDFPGVVLQLDQAPTSRLVLTHIFPAFTVALAESSDWPGILVWTRRGQGAFFPFGDRDHYAIRKRTLVDVKTLRVPLDAVPDLMDIRQLYRVAFPDPSRNRAKLHILQISDVHLGCPEAGLRLSAPSYILVIS